MKVDEDSFYTQRNLFQTKVFEDSESKNIGGRLLSTLKKRKKVISTRASQAVSHPSTNLALNRLTSEFEWDPVLLA